MGVFDKIKNALFEVEYVEVDEKPKKEKKIKPKEKTKEKKEEKPIAKKIVLPEKKDEKVEHIQEEELRDEDFEIRPKDETIKEKEEHDFKFMDDSDFKMDDEPQIVEVLEEKEEYIPHEEKKHEPVRESIPRKEEYKIKDKDSKPYGLDDSYKVSMHEYGTYDKKEEKIYFKPSPIISPIYGILDKNYKKEDVVSKKDIRITSNYSRSNVNVDDIRNKAFGRRSQIDNSNVDKEETTFDVEEEEDNVLVDLSDEKEKPEVKQVTVGDAMEYFQDLGLEYNVDYVDATKEKKEPTKKEEKLEEDIKQEMVELSREEKKKEKKSKKESDEIKKDVPEKNEVKDTPEKKKSKEEEIDDDNLFDLIDSMYKEED